MQNLTLRYAVAMAFTLSLGLRATAQDKQFTQFYAAPLTLNPALTGAFEGRYRVSAIYRDQWRNVLEEPVQSYAVAGDFRFTPRKKKVVQDAIGLGLVFDNDRVGVLDFNTTQIGLSLAYHKSLDVDNRQYLSAGLQAGITQRNLNYESLRFHDQFDGVSGYTGSTQEDLPANNFAYLDLSTGINYSAQLGRRSNVFVGLAYHHFNRPVVAFDKTDTQNSDRLFARYSAQFAANMPLGGRQSRVTFLPRVLVSNQGPHFQTNVGANFRTAMGEYRTSALHLGSWVRPVRNAEGFGMDAAVILVGIEFNNVLLGLSYDLNLQALSARQRQGAFEISIAYLGSFEAEGILCPKF